MATKNQAPHGDPTPDADPYEEIAWVYTIFSCDNWPRCTARLDYDEPYDAQVFGRKAKDLGWYADQDHKVFCPDCRKVQGL